MKVSIIIVNYKTKELTKNTIESVISKTKSISYEIIVVDNNSNDESAEYLQSQFGNKIIFISNKENAGFGKANNIGAKFATGKYLFLLNSDTILLNNAVKILADHMDSNNNIGISGANLFYEDMTPAHSFGKKLPSLKTQLGDIFSLTGIKKKLFRLSSEFNFSNKLMEVGYITGADMMIQKNIFDNLNGFDDDFFMYYEETELTHRVKKLGYKIISIPKAKIIHLEGKSFEFKEKRTQMKYESMYKYFNKVHGTSSLFKVFMLLNFFLLSRFVLFLDKSYLKMYSINREEYYKEKNRWKR